MRSFCGARSAALHERRGMADAPGVRMLTLLLVLGVAPEPSAKLMRGNLASTYALQPYLQSASKFRDPQNADVILDSLDQLGRLEHAFMSPYGEPTPRAISTLFAEQVNRARAEFKSGDTEPARMKLRGLTGMCLSCHTRSTAPKLAELDVSANRLELTPSERAAFLAAARQIDPALDLWREQLAKPPQNVLEAYDQALALRAAVGVAVRAKDDPQLTLALLELVKNGAALPPFARLDATEWAKQAQAWKGERFIASAQPGAALFARAKALIEATPALGSVAPDDEHLIDLQRAASYLNRALQLEPKAKWRGEALYLLAVASAAALDPELWLLDEPFLEACVHENPHSKLAVRCVDRLADQTLYRYTFAGVTNVPIAVGSRLGELRALAK